MKLIFSIIAKSLFNPTKIAQSNRHLTTTQSCLQYPNQEWLLQYPMLETHIFKVEEGVMKVDIFKKLENTEIWEFRTLYNGICYRLFSFWDTEEETLVIATHGIIKKTQKTPLKEIAKAEEIRKEYFNSKKK
jgi:phage-related protein